VGLVVVLGVPVEDTTPTLEQAVVVVAAAAVAVFYLYAPRQLTTPLVQLGLMVEMVVLEGMVEATAVVEVVVLEVVVDASS
jgi:hypothetical protein